MKRKLKVFFICLCAIVLSILLSCYVFALFRYDKGFVYGTKINGYYVGTLTVDEVNTSLSVYPEGMSLKVSCEGFEDEYISLADIDYQVDYTKELRKIFLRQNNILWFMNLTNDIEYTIEPSISYDKEKLSKCLERLEAYKANSGGERLIALVYSSEDGYVLSDNEYTYLDFDVLLTKAFEALVSDYQVTVTDEYFKLSEPTKDGLRTISLYEELKDTLSFSITYNFGEEEEVLDYKNFCAFVTFNELENDFIRDTAGRILIDDEKALLFLADYLAPFNLYKKQREYTTYLGETKLINLSTYGNELDMKNEEEFFINALKEGKDVSHEPVYIHEAFCKGRNDIGNTFIEIDLTNQLVYYIVDNELLMECDIVSGNPNKGYQTPQMISYINKKSRRINLKGEDYVSFVEYWMAFYGRSLGLHDASWQKKFGGDRYLTHGSRGCINMRLDDVSKMYELVEVGTPVIVYK